MKNSGILRQTAQQAHAVRRRYASSKIGAILKASFGSTVISIYRGGAADAQALDGSHTPPLPNLAGIDS